MTVQLQANKAFDAQDIERLVQDHQVHRDVYTSQDVYALEMQHLFACLLYTSPSPRDKRQSRMPSSA